LLALMVLGLSALGWISVAPNRLLPGDPLSAAAALGPAMAFGIALLVVAGIAVEARWPALAAALTLLALALVLGGTGLAATFLLEGRPPAARAMPGAGAWLTLAVTALLWAEQMRALRSRWLFAAVALGAFLLAASSGVFDALSLAVEARARAGAVQAALLRHAALAAAALGLALAMVLPLAWWGFRAPRAAAAVGAVFGGIQVVPSLALFGLLIPLLSLLLGALPALRAAGLQAIGATPALLAVASYLALPLWRAVLEGFAAADPAAVEAARAMGMSEGRIAREVRLPLGLPVFAAGLRVAAVQAVGLMTLGGLVGAGGLGALVFEGMSQLAADLILLGALPIIALALAADAALAALARRLGA
jgi:osmoprotectant transport system permease protein